MSKASSNVLKKSLNNTIEETVKELIQKSIKEGIQESSESTIKKTISKSLTTMLQKNIDDILSDNLNKIYKDSLNEILLETSEDLVSNNITKMSKDITNDLVKKNPELLKTLVTTQKENLKPVLEKIVKDSFTEISNSPAVIDGVRIAVVKSGNDKIISSLDSISPNASSLSKTDNVLREELTNKININKGITDNLSSSYEKAKKFIENNKRLLFKVAGIATAIGAIPLMSLILNQIVDKETSIGNVTKIEYINKNTLNITVSYNTPIKFCPNDSIKVKYFNGVNPNINNTQYKVNIISNENNKNYVLKLNGTPSIFSVDQGANGQITSTYGFYDQLGCNLLADDTPTDNTPIDDTPTDNTPTDNTPTDGKPKIETPSSFNKYYIILIFSIIIIILLFIFFIYK